MKVFTLEMWDDTLEVGADVPLSIHLSKLEAELRRQDHVDRDAHYGESNGYRIKERELKEEE